MHTGQWWTTTKQQAVRRGTRFDVMVTSVLVPGDFRERVRQVLEAAVPEWGMNICERLQHYRACFTAQLHF